MALTIPQLQALGFGYLTGSDLLDFCPGQLLIKQETTYGNLQSACDNALAETLASLSTRYNLSIEFQKLGFAPALLLVVYSGGAITGVTVIQGGAGYQSAPVLKFSGSGTGAAAHAVITNGAISSVVLDAPGTGYTLAPTISLMGGGPTSATGATAHAVLTNGGVTEIDIDNAGSGYYNPPEVTLIGGFQGAPLNWTIPAYQDEYHGGEGPLFYEAVAVAAVAGGQITSISMVRNGRGYTSAPVVIIAPRAPVQDNREKILLKICKILAVRNAMGNMQNISEKMLKDFDWATFTLRDIRRGQIALQLPQPNNPRRVASPGELIHDRFRTLG